MVRKLKKSNNVEMLKKAESDMKIINEMNGIEILSDENGNCNNCNHCCSIVTLISKDELEILASKLTNEIINDFVDRINKDGIKHVSFCPYSYPEKGCILYKDRPKTCVSYHCNPEKMNFELAIRFTKKMESQGGGVPLFEIFHKKNPYLYVKIKTNLRELGII
ncbi:MAG: YkgJ family cysteine cluster protein [Cetobacterium sp.]